MAVTVDAATLKRVVNGIKGSSDADIARMLATATELVTAEVVDIDDVPDNLANQCVIRVVTFIRQSENHIGQLEVETRQFAVSPVRASGARAMLAPYLSMGV